MKPYSKTALTIGLLGLVLPTLTVLLFKPNDDQKWKRGLRYVQQRFIHPCLNVFFPDSRRGFSAIRLLARISRR